MALTVFQEQIPFTNQRVSNQVSSGTYYNPIVMPLSFNVIDNKNYVEVVFYIRNDDRTKYYSNVFVSLVKTGWIVQEPPLYLVNSAGDGIITMNPQYFTEPMYYLSYSKESFPILEDMHMTFSNDYTFVNQYTDSNIDVKFSYGYDELSNVNWSLQHEMLLIDKIGNSTMYDLSYIPIRMRIELKTNTPVYTLRDYSLDITYQHELTVTG